MKNLGNLLDGYHGIKIGNFTGAGHQQVLINGLLQFNDGSLASQWYLGDMAGGPLLWNLVNQTSQFVPSRSVGTWISVGNFTGAGREQVLYYGNGPWWLGDMAGGQLGWENLVSHGIGDLPDGRHGIWIGNFTGAGHQQVLIYNGGDGRGDGQWYFGDIAGGPLGWKNLVSQNAEVGNLVDGFHGTWIGDFTGAGHQQVLAYTGGEGYWFLGDIAGGQFVWKNRISKTAGDLLFDNDRGLLVNDHRIWIGDFTGAGHQQCLVLDDRDGRWYLGDIANGTLNWKNVGNSAQYGNLLGGNHEIWIGNFTGARHQQVLFYYNGDGNWFLGDMANGKLNWKLVDNSSGFGRLLDSKHLIWIGNFTGAGHQQVLFYYNDDGNWFLGDMANGKLNWDWMGSTGA